MPHRTRLRWFLFAALAAAVVTRLSIPFERVTADSEFTGQLDLAHGVTVKRVDLEKPHVHLVVARAPRRKGVALRAVQGVGRRPLAAMAASVHALAAVNGDYHEMPGEGHPYLVGRTYSTLVTGGDPNDLGRYRVVTPVRSNDDASFYLDEGRVPHLGRLDLGVSLGLPASVDQGFHDRRAAANLVTEPLPGDFPLKNEVAFPVERQGDAWRITGSAQKRLSGPSLLVRQDSVAALSTAVVPGALVKLAISKRVDLAIGTGPRLLEEGKIPGRVYDGDEQWSRYPRTVVGFSKDAIFLVATVQEAHNRVSMVGIAQAMQALGCSEALNLDGGPSTAMWADGRMVSETPDFSAISDVVGSALCFVPATEGQDDVQ